MEITILYINSLIVTLQKFPQEKITKTIFGIQLTSINDLPNFFETKKFPRFCEDHFNQVRSILENFFFKSKQCL
jgi:hypothetical protein